MKMKRILIVVVMLCLAQASFAQNDMQNMAGMQKQATATYTCPMHPGIPMGQPGNCPKCGLTLVKEKPKAIKKAGNGRQTDRKSVG